MRLAATSLLALLLQAAPCRHPVRGDSRPVDLAAVERAHRAAARALSFELARVETADALARPFDSGLPSCRAPARRCERVGEIPVELVGRVLRFGPRPREGALHVITSAKTLRDAAGSLLAGPAIAERLRVRCVPATVRVRTATEIEIDEGD